jgi:cob(I)alamin adenosyltransferase
MVAQIKSVKTTKLNSPDAKMTLPVTPSRGLMQVVTSPTRGFYADIMAQALRVAGQGKPTLVVQFFQGGIRQGPHYPRRLVQNLDWLRCDLERHIDPQSPDLTEAETQAVLELWQHTKDAIAMGHYDMFVLDELSLAIKLDLIKEIEVLKVLQSRPHQVEVILTGTNMPASLIECADLVTQRRN